MQIREIHAKMILSPSKVYDWTINAYVGCAHGCSYCYARFMKRFSGHQENWGDFVDVKINAPELLAEEIKKKKRGGVWISGVCDAYQPLEKKYQLTRRCLEILQANQWPVAIQTKSSLVLKDLDVLKKFSDIEVGFTITTGDEKIRKTFEPHAPLIQDRIDALAKLHAAGIKTYVMIAPLLPGAESLSRRLEGKIDYALIDKINYHYADGIYRRYRISKNISADELVRDFRRSHIPCRVLF